MTLYNCSHDADRDDVPVGDGDVQARAPELLVQHEVLLPGQSHGRHALPDLLPLHLRDHRVLHDVPTPGAVQDSMFILMCILTSLVAQSLGLVIGCACDMQSAVYLGPITTIPVLLFSGNVTLMC